MSELERSLRELEIATAAAAEVRWEDRHAARATLKRRSKAIARLAELNQTAQELPEEERGEVLRRLAAALRAGEEIAQRLGASQQQAAAEWSRWNRVLLALGAGQRGRTASLDVRA